MTTNEVQGFRKILTARVAELEQVTRRRDGITIERSADLVEEVQWASERALAVTNLDRDFSQLRNARAALRSYSRMAASGRVSECDEDIHPKRLAASALGRNFVSSARKPSTTILERSQVPARDLLGRAA